MVRDIKRRRKQVLEPIKKSYLFRPLKDRNGNILKMPLDQKLMTLKV